ncbi:MAG TPA: type II secretion system protein GspM [Verrucomicrobiae bacterium]
MKRLPATKRNQLIMVVVATAVLIGLVYFLLIGPQKKMNQQIGSDIRDAQNHLQQMEDVIKKSETTSSKLTDVSLQLAHAEEDLASGDVYLWASDLIRRFKTAYHVEIPSVSQPAVDKADSLFPDFPYEQVKFSINGTAYYHDLGKFVAGFENTFPHMRMVNLTIEPANTTPGASEQLTFRIDIIALVKPTT